MTHFWLSANLALINAGISGLNISKKQNNFILHSNRIFFVVKCQFLNKNSTYTTFMLIFVNIEVKSNLTKSELLCTRRAGMIRIVQKRGQNPISKLYTMIQIVIQMRTITPNYHLYFELEIQSKY